VSAPNPRQVVTDAIREQEPKPTQLLALLSSQLSYGKIQDILSELLELGTVELGSDRRLRMVLRERPVPAAAPQAESVNTMKTKIKVEFEIECDDFDADYNNVDELADHFSEYLIKVDAQIVPDSFKWKKYTQAESVPSGKDVAQQWLNNKLGCPFTEQHNFIDHNGRNWNLAELLNEFAELQKDKQ
jgi:hypothetical protein